MKKKNKYIILPHIRVSFLIHLGLFASIIVICLILFSDESNNYYFLLSLKIIGIVLVVILLVSAIILNIFYWNAPVVIDAEGMSQRHGLHKIKLTWGEIDAVQCHTHWPKFYKYDSIGYVPELVFISTKQGYKVSMVMGKRVRKVFFTMCGSSRLKQKCKILLDAWDFPLP